MLFALSLILNIIFTNKVALNNLDLNISSGEVFALLGQNGAGKTTTINLFLGFVTPTSGSTTLLHLLFCAKKNPRRGFFRH